MSRRQVAGPRRRLTIWDLGAIPRPDRTEERRLLTAAQAGDAAARTILIQSHIKMVVAIAQDYFGSGPDQDDLIAEGMVGLVRAVDTFDLDRPWRLSTHAATKVRWTLVDLIRQHRRQTGWRPEYAPNPASEAQAALFDRVDTREELETVLAVCAEWEDPEMRKVFYYRHGLNGHPHLTFDQIATALRRCKQFCLLRHREALRRLRKKFAGAAPAPS